MQRDIEQKLLRINKGYREISIFLHNILQKFPGSAITSIAIAIEFIAACAAICGWFIKN
jgi:hypothetical protein